MADTTTSPNMNLPVPTVSVDPGPDWANNLNSCLGAIDSHNHSLNQGVQINPDGININADLPMNQNNLITGRSVRFDAQLTPISAPEDLGCLYESGVDLYYNDGLGAQIRITQSGSVTGASGTITGLPSGTASVSYAAGTFTFQQATNTPGAMAVGPTKIAQPVVSGKGVTISASLSQTGDYSMTLPAGLPGQTAILTMDTSGNLSNGSFFVQTTYTPSFSSLLNISAVSAVQFQYSRIGSAVTVWGNADITFTAASTLSSFQMTVPVNRTTNFLDSNVGGMVQAVDPGGLITMGVRGGGGSTTAVTGQGTTFAGETGIKNCRFHFTYFIG